MPIENSRSFFITGGTGFLGSYLVAALCRKNYQITLSVRPKNGYDAETRVRRAAEWFGLTEDEISNISIGDHCHQGQEIIHCASDTDFAERNRREIEASNLQYLEEVLKMAKSKSASRFHYLGTAYSAGAVEGDCPEELTYPEKFTNVYEETKNRAERKAYDFCKNNGIKLSIYRPSIVYGESGTGRSRKFNALYYPVKAISFIKEIMLKDILEKVGKRAEALGVKLKEGGKLVMPIRLKSISGGKLNLIPVDFFTKAMTAIIEKNTEDGIFHIVNSGAGDLNELIEYTSEYFGIEGLKVVNGDEGEIKDKNGLEQLFESYVKMYLPYIADRRVFLTDRTAPLLESENIYCPKMNYDIFKRCMDYAVASGWKDHM